MDIDPQFKRTGQTSAKRRAARLRQRVAVGLAGAVVCGLLGWGIWGLWPTGSGTDIATVEGDGDQIVQVDEGAQTAASIRVETPFVDIAGDPMILRFESGADRKAVELPGPPTLDAARFGPVFDGRFVLVRDDLIVSEKQLMTALPSSREDFAFFQAQRSQSLQPTAPVLPETAPQEDSAQSTEQGAEVVVTDGDNSWGETLSGEPVTVSYTQTAIQNTTSIAFVRAEAVRAPVYKDVVLRIQAARTLADILKTNGFTDEQATAFSATAEPLLPDLSAIPLGSIIALRIRPDPKLPEVLNLSLYGPSAYIGALARVAPGRYVPGADAWIDDDLPKLASAQGGNETIVAQNFRLLDGFYSAAIRNGVPTALVGEAIVLMSKSFDMEVIAAEGDRMTLLYAPKAADAGSGPAQIVYASIAGPSGDKTCYVTASPTEPGKFTCFSNTGRATASAGQLGGGLIQPTQGTLTSTFGPRFHPILKVVKLHAGVDWAAPTGTPIVAAGAGTINFAGVSESYGNVVYIDHAGGIQTRYAHMNAFADGIKTGGVVKAGDLIGFIGTTGRSTGPHLHFEVHLNGVAVDPFTLGGAAAPEGGAAPPQGGLAASDAVEQLTNIIIKVESGGNATAKNPLSSATGLGQFIESTWLRMMQDYRPDLTANMSREDVLNLRNDPTLSREMVQNLARENESFLRSKGHSITAGRLYLAHFLGPGGASTVLSATDDQRIIDVMGQGVVNANPFLTNYTVADLKNWAERKMSGHAGAGSSVPAVAVAAPVPEVVKVYMQIVDQIIAEATPKAADTPVVQGETPTPDTPPPEP
jgi:murein DD-endopeptidase MepM/ murein hydrolase activator NlpD